MSKFTPEELELIEVLKKYGNRGNLRKRKQVLYKKLLQSRQDILNEAFPLLHRYWDKQTVLEEALKYTSRKSWILGSGGSYNAALRNGWLEEACKHMGLSKVQKAQEKLRQCKSLYKAGEARPGSGTELGRFLEALIRARPKKFKNLFPKWVENSKMTRSFNKMIQLMPKHLVSFKKGQKWKGTNYKYTFICKEFGEFKSTPSSLMINSWKEMRSGHPEMGRLAAARSKQKKVKRSDGKIFNSASEASNEMGLSRTAVSTAIRSNCKCGGYTFEYVDD